MRGDAQLVLVDLPGVQRPRDTLTQRMQSRVEREFGDADAALLMLNGEQGVGPGDRFIAAALARAEVPVAIAINKVDRIDNAHTLAMLQAAGEPRSPTGSSRSPRARAPACRRSSSTS